MIKNKDWFGVFHDQAVLLRIGSVSFMIKQFYSGLVRCLS